MKPNMVSLPRDYNEKAYTRFHFKCSRSRGYTRAISELSASLPIRRAECEHRIGGHASDCSFAIRETYLLTVVMQRSNTYKKAERNV